MYVFANLTDSDVAAVQQFEKEKGFRVVALKDVPVDTAALDDQALQALKALEKRLDMCLVAVA